MASGSSRKRPGTIRQAKREQRLDRQVRRHEVDHVEPVSHARGGSRPGSVASSTVTPVAVTSRCSAATGSSVGSSTGIADRRRRSTSPYPPTRPAAAAGTAAARTGGFAHGRHARVSRVKRRPRSLRY